MKTLIIGAEGQLGTELRRVFADVDLATADVAGAHIRLDVTDGDALERVICDEVRPELVINTSAAHNVPKCEEDPRTAFAVNATAPQRMARICNEIGARLLHISTDYVFGDGGTRPYVESDPVAPLSTYGASKAAGEFLIAAECPNHCIVRAAALYGPASCLAKGGRNFVGLMRHLARTKGEVRVVTDEITTPTYTVALAEQIRVIAQKAEPGIYHASCNGACSWYDFAEAAFALTGVEVKLMKATSADFPSTVKRPNYSVLENRRLKEQGLDIMPEWREALAAYVKTLDD